MGVERARGSNWLAGWLAGRLLVWPDKQTLASLPALVRTTREKGTILCVSNCSVLWLNVSEQVMRSCHLLFTIFVVVASCELVRCNGLITTNYSDSPSKLNLTDCPLSEGMFCAVRARRVDWIVRYVWLSGWPIENVVLFRQT